MVLPQKKCRYKIFKNNIILISHYKLLAVSQTVQLILISFWIICAITEATLQRIPDNSQVYPASTTDAVSHYETLQRKTAESPGHCIKTSYPDSIIHRIARKARVRKKRSPQSAKNPKTVQNVTNKAQKFRTVPAKKQSRTVHKKSKESRTVHKKPKESRTANKKSKQSRTVNKKPKESRTVNKKPKESRTVNKKTKESRTANTKSKQSRTVNKKPKESRTVSKKPKESRTVNEKPKNSGTVNKNSKQSRSTNKRPKNAKSVAKKAKNSRSAHTQLDNAETFDDSTNLEGVDADLLKEIQRQEKGAVKYLESIERNYSQLCHADSVVSYAQQVGRDSEDDDEDHPYDTTTEKTLEEYFEAEEDGQVEDEKEDPDPMSEFQQKIQKTFEKKFYHWRKFSDPILRKEITILLRDGTGNMTEPDIQKLSDITGQMDDAFIQATVCEYRNRKNCKLYLEPDITLKMEESRDYDELVWYWEQWHDSVGGKISPELYSEFIRLNNVLAKANQYKNNVVQWMDAYNEWTPDWSPAKFRTIVFNLWKTIRPYYRIIHAYVRMKLQKFSNYSKYIKKCGYLPAHILGNMYGQTWTALDDITKPYPNAPSLDATKAMRLQGYTPTKMMQLADEFFQGLGLIKATNTFWKQSVFERPPNVNMSCHASAFDMCLGKGSKDFRISMCATITQRDFVTMHHELGHIQYFMQYSNLRYAFRGAANPAFDESVGDALAMSVTTPEHLQCKLGLELGADIDCSGNTTKQDVKVTKNDINHLFLSALDSFPFFPFAMAMDHWRWLVMEEKMDVADYNTKWWRMRKDYQGIVPPNPRPPTSFDAAAKYHVVVHVSYVRYFLSSILQYQFYEALCKASGEYDPKRKGSKPLYRCDFSGSKKAGELFGNLLKLGSRKPWPEALQMVTGQTKMSATPMLNYFKPLFQKLKHELKKANEYECLSKPWQE